MLAKKDALTFSKQPYLGTFRSPISESLNKLSYFTVVIFIFYSGDVLELIQ